jgi:hypothetical protein
MLHQQPAISYSSVFRYSYSDIQNPNSVHKIRRTYC